MTHVVVVGGGITGLAAAWFLRAGPPTPADSAGGSTWARRRDDGGKTPPGAVTLLEATGRLGGKLSTHSLDGLTVERGADALVARHDAVLDLIRAVGLEDETVSPATTAARVWHAGRTYPLPGGLVVGVPTRLGPLVRSRLISPAGAARAALDLLLPREVDVDTESVAELVRHRFGHQIADRLVEPVLTGIYAGSPAQLGVAAATPALAGAARHHRSVMRGLRVTGGADGSTAPFVTIRGGLTRLVDRLVRTAPPGGAPVTVSRSTPVRLVEAGRNGYVARLPGGEQVFADAVVLAVPTYVAAAVLRPVLPDAVGALREIPYVSVATIILVYPPGTALPPGSGMVVPATAGRLVKAATWVSAKWPHLTPGGEVVVRASVGRRGDEEALRLDDAELARAVHEDLCDLVGVSARPCAWLVTRWERAVPQYEPAHLDRLDRVQRALAAHPRLALAGAGYQGVGISACVQQAHAAARRIRRALVPATC